MVLPHPKLNLKAAGLSLLSALLLTGSWPETGGFWPLMMVAFVPLFKIVEMAVSGDLTNVAARRFIALAFFIWNSATLCFLFELNDNLGTKLISMFTPVLVNTLLMTATFGFFLIAFQKKGKYAGLFVFIAAWMAMEWLHHHWSLAFPWLSLGNVMAVHTQWVQWYEFTGVGGGTWWLLVINAMIFAITLPQRKLVQVFSVSLTALLISAPLLVSRIIRSPENNLQKSVRYTAVQPCLDLKTDKFSADGQLEQLQGMLEMAFSSADSFPGVVVLPETALYDPGTVSGTASHPRYEGMWIHNPAYSTVGRALFSEIETGTAEAVIAGVFATEASPLNTDGPNCSPVFDLCADYYNSVLIADSAGYAFRHKVMLVAGVEQVPFASYFPWLRKLVMDFGGYVGVLNTRQSVKATAINKSHKAGTMICYDSAFGWLGAELVRDGAEVLVVVTNDAWWGDTPGYRQLFSFARLRAIETRRPLVRSANNGISAVIRADGTVADKLQWDERSALTAEIFPASGLTFYSRFGDWPYAVSTFMLPFLFIYVITRKRPKE
jgi:apolipoprotein N-acyltransferase